MSKEVEIVENLPPEGIYEICQKKFGVDFRRGVAFPYGNKIYLFRKDMMTPDLLVHEKTHIEQQKQFKSPKEWWNKYLSDSSFRLGCEIEAYQNQWKFVEENYNRKDRRGLLEHMSKLLSGRMYGSLIKKREAKNLILNY